MSESKNNIWVGVFAVAVMIGVMVGSIYYPFPSGEPMRFSSFVQLWLREIIVVGFLALVFIIAGVRWLWRHIKQLFHSEHNAP